MGKPEESQRTTASEPISPLERQMPRINLEELVRRQGAIPYDPATFDALWPEEFDPDAFLAWHQQYRVEQRSLPPKDKFNF